MIRLWQRSLAARFIALILLALILAQGAGVLIFREELDQELRAAARNEWLNRTASLVVLLENTPPTLHQAVLGVSGNKHSQFWISSHGPVDVTSWWREARRQFQASATTPLASSGKRLVSLAKLGPVPPWEDLAPVDWPLARAAKYLAVEPINGLGLAVPLENGDWLNALQSKSISNVPMTTQALLSLVLTAITLSLIAALAAREITRPMRRLAVAAERLGRGEPVSLLAETGPDDIRHTAEAFNRMQARLQRLVDDRTLMLAAIGHDLRTPLTSLRLRAEFVTDAEIREKMLTTIEEVRHMTEAALTYAREGISVEVTRDVDVCALVESLCDDLAEIGMPVSFAGGAKMPWRCRPEALRRALRNLIENAVRYGHEARVSITVATACIDIFIEDNGPGISADAHEQVFAPLFRLEASRNSETGGIGLGLSIARAIVRQHGGDISLGNLPVGLRAQVHLPAIHHADTLRQLP